MSGAENGTVEAAALEMAAKVFDRLAGCTIPLNFAKRVRDGEKSDLVEAFKNAVTEALSPATEQSLAGEVVAWMYEKNGVVSLFECRKPAYTSPVMGFHETPLYATPQPAPVTGGEDQREALRKALQFIDLAAGEGLLYRAGGEVLDAGDIMFELAHVCDIADPEVPFTERLLDAIAPAALSPSAPEAPSEQEGLAEALLALSDRLRWSRFLDDDKNHAAYERVVAEFTRARKGATS